MNKVGMNPNQIAFTGKKPTKQQAVKAGVVTTGAVVGGVGTAAYLNRAAKAAGEATKKEAPKVAKQGEGIVKAFIQNVQGKVAGLAGKFNPQAAAKVAGGAAAGAVLTAGIIEGAKFVKAKMAANKAPKA